MTVAIDSNDTISPNNNTPETSSLPSVKTLFVWDFDWTIVNCNSDEYVPAKFLGDETTNKRFHELIDELGPEKWHDCVATLINSCITKSSSSSSSKGNGNDAINECTTKQDICEAAASMPFLSNVKAALDTVVANANNDTLLSNNNCGQMILSDGNDEFIHSFLKKNGLETSFSHGVETNFARWTTTTTNGSNGDGEGEGGEIMSKEVFSVVHQSTKYGGHDCPRCPPNLCKTQVLRDVLSRMNDDDDNENNATTSKPRIVYVGDGSNDTCPTLNVLTKGDVLLARDGCKISNPNTKVGNQQCDEGNVVYSDNDSIETTRGGSKKFPILAVLERAKEREGLVPKCKVCPWTSGTELFELVEGILNEN